MENSVNLLRSYAYKMMNQPMPSEQVLTSPLLSITTGTDAHNVLIWRGALGAAKYSIERSTQSSNGPWTTICNGCATDDNVPWIDQSTLLQATWYRVIPYAITGVAGNTSNVYEARVKE